MEKEEVLEIIKMSRACLLRATKDQCDGDCNCCTLFVFDKDMMETYDTVIDILEEKE